MSPCDKYVVKTLRYLDDDLKGVELKDFRSHLHSCPDCRVHLDAERVLSETLHRFRPLYPTPDALRDRVSAASIQESLPSLMRDSYYQHASRILSASLSGALENLSNWRVLVPATLAIVLCLALAPNIVRHVQASSYVETAIAVHRNSLSEDLPSGLQSNSPQDVMAWFVGRLPFTLQLPSGESLPWSKPAYRLTGAAVVGYKGHPAALIRYEGPKGKISLLVVSSRSAVIAGGEEVSSGRLTFHFRRESGFWVITWSNHDLSYALVSSVSESARASCLVCHQNMTDHHDLIAH